MNFLSGSVPKCPSTAAHSGLESFHPSPYSRPFEAIFQFPDEDGGITTSHRVDGLAFLNDDVIGEYEHNSPMQKNSQAPQHVAG